MKVTDHFVARHYVAFTSSQSFRRTITSLQNNSSHSVRCRSFFVLLIAESFPFHSSQKILLENDRFSLYRNKLFDLRDFASKILWVEIWIWEVKNTFLTHLIPQLNAESKFALVSDMWKFNNQVISQQNLILLCSFNSIYPGRPFDEQK